jgi:hypothetical protein
MNHMKTTATTEAVSSPPAPDKTGGLTGKMTCKFREQAENHENNPRRSWALNHMGNVRLKGLPAVGNG